MPRFDDDDAQVDGDVQYQRVSAGQPWLRSGVPPWHMWGNTERFDPVSAGTPSQTNLILGRQLIRVSYKRPESWKWLFVAKIIKAPQAGIGGSYELFITFDVTIGLGRSSVTLPAFDTLKWSWLGIGPAPVAYPIWVASAVSPPTIYNFQDGLPITGFAPGASSGARTIDRLVAQDIQVNCSVQLTANEEPEGGPAAVEVSAYFSPATHVRPDWMLNAVPEVKFGGDEIAGR